jgi:hypothetical protein
MIRAVVDGHRFVCPACWTGLGGWYRDATGDYLELPRRWERVEGGTWRRGRPREGHAAGNLVGANTYLTEDGARWRITLPATVECRRCHQPRLAETAAPSQR